MAREWKFYAASAEQYRAHNVFQGPLRLDDGQDRFFHYLRQGKLGLGTDYFGIFCEDHKAWEGAQPKELGLKEVERTIVPTVNPYTRLWAAKAAKGEPTEDMGLESALELEDIPKAG